MVCSSKPLNAQWVPIASPLQPSAHAPLQHTPTPDCLCTALVDFAAAPCRIGWLSLPGELGDGKREHGLVDC